MWAEERGQISHRVEFGRRGVDTRPHGRMDKISVLCLAASQLSALMEIPSPLAAAQTVCLCRPAVDWLSEVKGRASVTEEENLTFT